MSTPVPTPPTVDPTYTSHAATAAVISGGMVEIATWVASLYHVSVPATVAAASVAIITPFLSVGLKKAGVLSS